MTITIKHVSGVGVNGRYQVYRDKELVAFIRRRGKSRFVMESVHYYDALAVYPNIDRARQAAMTFDFPDVWTVYERICERVERQRRSYFRNLKADELADAARDLANGSNSAHDVLVALSNEIEAIAGR